LTEVTKEIRLTLDTFGVSNIQVVQRFNDFDLYQSLNDHFIC